MNIFLGKKTPYTFKINNNNLKKVTKVNFLLYKKKEKTSTDVNGMGWAFCASTRMRIIKG